MSAAEAWDAQSTTLEAARSAVWSEPDYDKGVDFSVSCILTALSLDDLPDGPLLELGCGVGRLTFPIAAASGRDVLGVDASGNMVALARDEAARRATATRFTKADLGNVWLPRGFAGAYSMLTFQHMPPEAVRHCIDETIRALLPGGRFVFQFVVGDHHEGLDHRYRLTEILNLAQGFDVSVGCWADSVFPEWAWVSVIKAIS